MTIPEIKAKLEKLKVEIPSGANKAELEKLLADAEKAKADAAKKAEDEQKAKDAVDQNPPAGAGAPEANGNAADKEKSDPPAPDATKPPEGGTPAPESVQEDIGEAASLLLCNLVASGLSVPEARKRIKNSKGGEEDAEQIKPRVNLIGLPVGHPDSVEGLREILTNRGTPVHPNMTKEKVISVYRKNVLGEAQA